MARKHYLSNLSNKYQTGLLLKVNIDRRTVLQKPASRMVCVPVGSPREPGAFGRELDAFMR